MSYLVCINRDATTSTRAGQGNGHNGYATAHAPVSVAIRMQPCSPRLLALSFSSRYMRSCCYNCC